MATKWKNSLLLATAVILCLGGWYLTTLSFMRVSNASGSIEPSASFMDAVFSEARVKNFKPTEAKNITNEQVESYRMKYGDFGTQVSDIQNQYQEQINAAHDQKKKTEIIAERDQKIKDITNNFTSDDIVKEKIIKEEKEYIEKNKEKILESLKSEISEETKSYSYYFKNMDSGEIYTNVASLNKYSTEKTIKQELKELSDGRVYEDEFTATNGSYVSNGNLPLESYANLKGSYIIKKDSDLARIIEKDKEDESFFAKLIYVGLVMMVAGIVALYIYINTGIIFAKLKQIPIDVLAVLFLVLGFIAASQVFAIYPYNQGLENNVRYVILPLGIGLSSLALSFIAFKLLWQKLITKYREQTFKELLEQSFVSKMYKKGVSIFKQLPIIFKIMVIGVIVFFNLLLLLFYTRLNYTGFIQPLFGLFALAIFITEIWLVTSYFNQIYQLLKKPKAILGNYEQRISSTFSLAETNRELLALDELVKLSQKDTLQSEMLKTELLTNVSHDLRTPLTSIITYGDLLTQPNTTSEEQEKYIKIINNKALRMKHLIDDLFEVTKMNNGEIVLEKNEVNLGKLLQQAVSERSDEFKEHQLKMVFNKPEEDIILSLDGERIWRVFDNMFSNALKYAMPDTRVYLKLEQTGTGAKIELKNISQHELHENAEELVEKFKRGDSSRHTEGSGLGLAIINSIVSLHDGNLEIIIDGDMFKLIINL